MTCEIAPGTNGAAFTVAEAERVDTRGWGWALGATAGAETDEGTNSRALTKADTPLTLGASSAIDQNRPNDSPLSDPVWLWI